jgi:threonine/homoserine/homoserine lactone efflux protein
VYLGINAIRHRRSLATTLAPPRRPSPRRLWRDGFVVGVTNPKTTLFFLAVLPQFVSPARGHASVQLLVLGVIFVVLAVVNDGLYAVAAGSVRRWVDRSPRRVQAVGGTTGVVMIGLGIRLAATGRHD